jgi:hypothetical protein
MDRDLDEADRANYGDKNYGDSALNFPFRRQPSSTGLRVGRLRPALARLEGAPGQSLKPGEKVIVPERSANALGRTQAGEQFRLRLAGKQIGEAGVTLPDGRQRR